MKRILTILLALLVMLSIAPVAFATDTMHAESQAQEIAAFAPRVEIGVVSATSSWTASSVSTVVNNGANFEITASGVTNGQSWSMTVPATSSKTKTISVPLKTCYDTVSNKVSVDGSASRDMSVARRISLVCVAKWFRGTFGTAEASIDYHFSKHGSEVGVSNVEAYVLKAMAFQKSLDPKLQPYGKDLRDKYRQNGRYIFIYGDKYTGQISSFGSV